MMCSSEDSDLKRLLSSWHCEILYNLFREEDITIEELKYIKYRHVLCLLKYYKMGVRIRFEHYLECWRNKIGIPFQTGDNQTAANYNACKRQQENVSVEDRIPVVHHAYPKSPGITCAPETTGERSTIDNRHKHLQSPQSLADSGLCKTVPSEGPPPGHAGHMLRSSGKRKERDPPALEVDENLNAGLLSTIDSPVNNNHNITSRNNFEKCPYSLAQILHMSGSRGIAIINYYEEHRELTGTQRSQLIQTICDFYEDNEFHLSLNMSHAIETEILQMFPTEKLHYYRTEKRGKLYVKFTNMKRYRRERGTNCRTKAIERGAEYVPFSALDRDENKVRVQNMADTGYTENNMDTSCDTWPEGAEAEINIKTEEPTE